jgi:hypothetical protein
VRAPFRYARREPATAVVLTLALLAAADAV